MAILKLGHFVELKSPEQSAVDRVLSKNRPVGVVLGMFDKSLTITSNSNFFIENLGYALDEYDEAEKHSLLDYIYESDRAFFTSPDFKTFQGSFQFRMVNKNGENLYTYGYKSNFTNSEGEEQWALSARVSRETVATHHLIRSLDRLIARYVICDVEKNEFAFYTCGSDEAYMAQGVYSDFAAGMVRELGISEKLDELNAMCSPENICGQLPKSDGLCRYDYTDEKTKNFYRMSVMPVEYNEGKLSKYLILVMDVTKSHVEEMRTRQALMDAYQAASQANEAKSQFLSSMSHDIRTPMNAIIGMTAIASAHIDEKERVLDALGKITVSSRHLLGLINDVLDMSRIERGKMSLNNECFSLPELVDSLIDMVKPAVISRNHRFETRILNIRHEEVIGDSIRIQQVFTNIVGNAVKYTPDGGTISLTISEKPVNQTNTACFEIIVEDTGIGMDRKFLSHVFEPFMRADNAVISGMQGSGLGMSIAKNIVSMMNGTIDVESEIGHGTKVTVTIFLGIQDSASGNDDLLANLPVLVVDDDVISCESTVETLISIGMQGEWVDNGKAAVESVINRHKDGKDYYAVILDWKMPDMDGVETARAIRRAVGNDIMIIMLTAFDFGEIEQKAREAGINYFVNKPLFRSRLRNAFKNMGSDSKAETAAVPAGIKPLDDYSGKRVLIVEDNELNCEIMTEILKETHVEIETAANGRDAVDMVSRASEGYYSLIFMDIQMPVMNGYEATAAIRALSDGKGAVLPIIALSASAFAEDVIMAKKAGANEHLPKPVDIARLAEVMRTWLR